MRRSSNPFLSPLPFPAAMANSAGRTTPSAASTASAPMPGRNLFEELQLAATDPTSDPSDPPDSIPLSRTTSASSSTTERPASSIRFSTPTNTASALGLRKRAWTSHTRTHSDQTGLRPSLLPSHFPAEDEDDSPTGLLRDIFRQTYDTARQALAYAQNVTIRSASVQRLQWWLVQVLLGPMMTRRMMARSLRAEGPRRSARGGLERKARGRRREIREWEREHALTVRGGGQLVQVSWIQRHNPWLWIRFSLALLFAIGAALRDGPGLVLGVAEEEERVD